MKYVYCKNLLEDAVSPIQQGTTPGDLPLAYPPALKTKSEFRSWCAVSTTRHCFYSANEGVNPHVRISDENPLHSVHGMVVDYDSHGTVADAVKAFVDRCGDTPPTWVSQTFSGNIRAVWEFASPVLVPPELARQFFIELASSVKAKGAYPGIDGTSFNPAQLFEKGHSWASTDPTNPPRKLSDDIIHTALFKTIGKHGAVLKADVLIPIDVVAEEVEKRFTGRWKGEFKVGARGPLFWINDGIDRVGCQVASTGIICYSNRGDKPFLQWQDIFGKKFVSDFETKRVSGMATAYWFDHNGNKYFTKRSGKFVPVAKEDMVIELKAAGFSGKVPKGKILTEIEEALRYIRNVRFVDGSAPVLYAKGDTVTINGQNLLNTSTVRVIEPHPTDGDPTHWAWIHKFLTNWFDPQPGPTGHPPLDYFLAWVRRFYESSLRGEPLSGQAIIIVGPTDRGKTLLSNRIIGGLMGGSTDATDFLMKRTAFNKQLSEVGVWAVDDAESTTNAASLRLYTEMLKKFAANPWIDARAMYKDAQRVPWLGRIMISANEDANSLGAIPALDQSNRDKLMCFKLSDARNITFPKNTDLEKIISAELPHFARWLLDWTPPAQVVAAPKRYGVVSYFHPSVESAARDNSPTSHIVELVELFVHRYRESNQGVGYWYGNVTELAAQMNGMSGLMHMIGSRDTLRLQRGMDTLVERSKTDKSAREVKSFSTGSGKVYMVSLDNGFDFDVSSILAQLSTTGSND